MEAVKCLSHRVDSVFFFEILLWVKFLAAAIMRFLALSCFMETR